MKKEMKKKEYLAYVEILLAAGYWGGVENVINRLGIYLQEHGFKVRVVQMICEGDFWADERLDFVYYFDSRLNMTLEKMYQGYKDLLQESEELPDVIIATNWPYMCYIAKRASKELGIKAPTIGYPHTNPWRFEKAGYGGTEMLDNADVCFAISDMIRDDIVKANPDNFVYRVNNPLPEGISPAPFQNQNPMHLAYVGRLNVEKRPELILRGFACSKYPYELFFVGDGSLTKDLKKEAKVLGVSNRVHFLGWQDEPWEAAGSCKFCVMASMYEGFSLAATEAMYRGMALISTPVSGSIELIEPGKTGYLFPQGDYKELGNILDKIAEGELPKTLSKDCVEKAIPFKSELALFDTSLKIYATSRHKYLPYRDVKIFKTSVILYCDDSGHEIEKCIQSIINQSIGMQSLEIILIHSNGSVDTTDILLAYENRYPDNIMIINCDEHLDTLAAMDIGLQYATGDYVYCLLDKKPIESGIIFNLMIDAITYRRERLLNIDDLNA